MLCSSFISVEEILNDHTLSEKKKAKELQALIDSEEFEFENLCFFQTTESIHGEITLLGLCLRESEFKMAKVIVAHCPESVEEIWESSLGTTEIQKERGITLFRSHMHFAVETNNLKMVKLIHDAAPNLLLGEKNDWGWDRFGPHPLDLTDNPDICKFIADLLHIQLE